MIRGMVPFKALAPYGMSEGDVYDMAHNRLMYIVNRNLTQADPLQNRARDRATIKDQRGVPFTSGADIVLIGYGPDKLGGIPIGIKASKKVGTASLLSKCDENQGPGHDIFKRQSCDIPSLPVPCAGAPDATANCLNDASNFKKEPATNGSTNIADYFDDEILEMTVSCPNGAMPRQGDGHCTNTYCWGDNSKGQLGIGSQSNDPQYQKPTEVAMPMPAHPGDPLVRALTDITGDGIHWCAKGTDISGMTRIYCWGDKLTDSTGVLYTSKIHTTPTNEPGTPTFLPTLAQPVISGTYIPPDAANALTNLSGDGANTFCGLDRGNAFCSTNGGHAFSQVKYPPNCTGNACLKFTLISVNGSTASGLAYDGKAYSWTAGTSILSAVTMPLNVNSFATIVAGDGTTCAITP